MANEAKIKLSAEGVQQVISAFRKVEQEANRAGKEGAKSFAHLGNSLNGIKNIVGAIGLGALVLKFKESARAAIDAADGVGDLAKATSASAEFISVLSLAAREAGAGSEVLEKGVVKLAIALDALKSGDRNAEELFLRMQLTARDFQNLSFDQSIEKVALRLGDMEGGERKVAIGSDLVGKKSLALLEVFDNLAEEGFDKVRDRALKLGVVFSQDMADAAGKAKQVMVDMEAKTQGAAAQFTFGLAPAISDVVEALDGLTGEKSGGGFKRFGEIAGAAVKFVAGLFIGLGKIIAGVKLLQEEWIKGVGEAFTAMLRFDVRGVMRANLDTFRNLRDTSGVIVDDIKKSFDDFVSGDEKETTPGAARPKRPGLPGIRTADLAKEEKARAELLRARLENEQKLFSAALALRSDAERRSFENGLTSLEEYFAARRKALKEESGKELQTLEAKRAIVLAQPLRDPGDAEKKARELAEINGQLSQKRIDTERRLADLIQEERVAIRDLGRERLQFDIQLLALQGQRFAAARAAFEEEVKRADELLRRQGVSDAERAKLIGRFETQGSTAIDFDEQHEAAEKAVRDLDLATAKIRRDVETGLLGQIEGEQKVVALQQQKLPLLEAEAEKLLTIARLSGDSARIDQAKQFKDAVAEIGSAANQTGRDIAEIRAAVESGGVSAGADFLNDIATKSKTASQAISDFGKSVLATFTSIISKKLSEKLFGSLFGGLGDLGGGVLGIFGLGGGTVQRKAEGGKIVGPGTGTSDSILAAGPMGQLLRVANGEFIVRAAVVQQPGMEAFLHRLNDGLRSPSLAPAGRIPRFAGGGVVGASHGPMAANGPGPLQVVISPDMAHLTLRDWLESHLARELANR